MFCLYVSLTISFLRAQTIETSSLPTDSSRPLFKRIETFSILTVWLYVSIVSTFLNIRASYWSTSLRGRRSKGKGKGIRTRDHARGRREEDSLPPSSRAPRLLSRLKLPFTKLPFPSLSLPFPFPFKRLPRRLLEYLLGITPSGRNPCGSNNHGDKSGWHSSLRKKKTEGGNKRRNIKLWSWREKMCLRRFYLEKNKKNAPWNSFRDGFFRSFFAVEPRQLERKRSWIRLAFSIL